MSEGEVQVNLIVYPNFPIILEILSNFMDNYRNVTGNGNGNPNREGTMILVLPRIYGFGGPQIWKLYPLKITSTQVREAIITVTKGNGKRYGDLNDHVTFVPQ